MDSLPIIVHHNSNDGKPLLSVAGFEYHSRAIKEADAWIEVSMPRYMNRKVMVAFSPRAHLACLKRYAGVIVVTWDEFKACAAGVAELSDPLEQVKRMKEALWFFAARQNIFIDD